MQYAIWTKKRTQQLPKYNGNMPWKTICRNLHKELHPISRPEKKKCFKNTKPLHSVKVTELTIMIASTNTCAPPKKNNPNLKTVPSICQTLMARLILWKDNLPDWQQDGPKVTWAFPIICNVFCYLFCTLNISIFFNSLGRS